jgi:hypothetical protein
MFLEWHTDHGVDLADPMYVVFNDTKAFLDTHPGEVIVIEVSHFMGGVTSGTLDILVNMIEASFGPYLYPRTNGFKDTISGMVAKNQRLLVTFDDVDSIAAHPNIWYVVVLC